MWKGGIAIDATGCGKWSRQSVTGADMNQNLGDTKTMGRRESTEGCPLNDYSVGLGNGFWKPCTARRVKIHSHGVEVRLHCWGWIRFERMARGLSAKVRVDLGKRRDF